MGEGAWYGEVVGGGRAVVGGESRFRGGSPLCVPVALCARGGGVSRACTLTHAIEHVRAP